MWAIGLHLYPKYYDIEVSAQGASSIKTEANQQAIEPNQNGAFTLAEILITLSIIGIVAALTIPGLIAKNQEKERVVQLKKEYNVFNNAFTLAKIEYGNPSLWNWSAQGSLTGAQNAYNKLAPYLNLVKSCGQQEGCFANVAYKQYNGLDYTNYNTLGNRAKGLLADGTSFYIYSHGGDCNSDFGNTEALKQVCGQIIVDINGFKKPNTLGKDVFYFIISSARIIPSGTPDETSSSIATCRTTGSSCAAWVLLKENMNYPPIGTGWD